MKDHRSRSRDQQQQHEDDEDDNENSGMDSVLAKIAAHYRTEGETSENDNESVNHPPQATTTTARAISGERVGSNYREREQRREEPGGERDDKNAPPVGAAAVGFAPKAVPDAWTFPNVKLEDCPKVVLPPNTVAVPPKGEATAGAGAGAAGAGAAVTEVLG